MKRPFIVDFATGAQIVLSAMALVLCGMAAGDYLTMHPTLSICSPWAPDDDRPAVSEVLSR